MILSAVDEIMRYAYAHCDEKLKAIINYEEFKTEEKSNLTAKEFSQAMYFMKCDGYFSNKPMDFSQDDKKPTFSVTILPRLIREFENPSR